MAKMKQRTPIVHKDQGNNPFLQESKWAQSFWKMFTETDYTHALWCHNSAPGCIVLEIITYIEQYTYMRMFTTVFFVIT